MVWQLTREFAMQTASFGVEMRQLNAHFSLRKPGTWFRVGNYINKEGHSNNRALLIIAHTCWKHGTIGDALRKFGELVSQTEQGADHPNIKALLSLKQAHGEHAPLAKYVEFENDKNPITDKSQIDVA